MKRNLFILISATAIVLAGLVVGCSREGENTPAPAPVSTNVTLTSAQRQRVQLQAVKRETFHRIIDTTGAVGFDADQSTTILAPISGPVVKLSVSLGAEVKAGDALAIIDSPDFAAAITAYRKALATAKNLRRVADLDGDLFKHGALAQRDLEQAQTDAANADADSDAALQQVHSLGVTDETIDDMQRHGVSTNLPGVLRSPLNGTVVEKFISPGQLLQAGTTPCFTVADLSQVWVMADFFEADLADVAIGTPAEIFTSASTQGIPGKVDNISAIVDPNTRSIGVRVVAKNPGHVLKKQMYVRVLIHSAHETTGLLVPVTAILRNDENLPFVYLALADNTFARRQVTLGSRMDDRYEIKSGLAEGDQVVTDGGLFMQFLQNQ